MPFREKIDKEVIKIVEELNDAGYETFIVGGAVRDLLIGRNPKDYDVASSATPEQIKFLFRRRVRIIGRRFRLVHYYTGRNIIEISTFRKTPDKKIQEPGHRGAIRHEENTYGSSTEDAWRRDLTVNAIFYDPLKDEIIDFTGMGVKDIEQRFVRTVGDPDIRFAEDPVRILRALKLVGQYSFSLEKNTGHSLIKNISLIKNSSLSRLSLELEKILKSPYSAGIFEAFYKHGFMCYFLPELAERGAESFEGKLMLELLKEWNLRISQGKYRPSLSIAVSLVCLPFMLRELCIEDSEKNEFISFDSERKNGDMILDLLRPHHFPKKLIAASRTILHMQPFLLKRETSSRMIRHKRYLHARELFSMVNAVLWKNPALDEKWPPHVNIH
jgi:poly(A) polymerase